MSAALAASVDVEGVLAENRIVPVVAVSSADEGLRLAEALLAGGIRIIEVTFRTDAATAALRAIARELPEIITGGGTLLSEDDVDRAVDAGARFGVAPGIRDAVVDRARSRGLGFVPGVSTASEIEQGLAAGLHVFKLFPAEPVGGTRLIDAFAGPYPGVRFLPTGGITPDNVGDYLSRPSVLACGGTWIAPRTLLDTARFDEISLRAERAAALAAASHHPRKEQS